jgi:integrase
LAKNEAKKLTKRVADAARAEGAERFLWDPELPGFGLRVRLSGRRYYVIQYRSKGRTRRLTLGPHGALTPDRARRKAAKLLAEAHDGGDPAVTIRSVAKSITVADLGKRFLAQHAELKKKPSSVRNDRLNLRLHVLPRLGPIPLAAVTRADIASLHHALRQKPTAANRVLALLSKMFNLAERWGLRVDGTNPCRHVERFPERPRERFLSDDELARLGTVLKGAEEGGLASAEAVAAIRLLLLTGCRVSEVLRLRWEDVDIERRCLKFADSKTGAKRIPLNSAAILVLDGVARRSAWVIPGRDPSESLVNLAKPWDRIRELAKLDGVRLHDLRHTHGSSAAGAGLSLHLVGALLGHRQPATTARYAHLAEDPVRDASERVGERLASAMQGSSAGQTPPARRTYH